MSFPNPMLKKSLYLLKHNLVALNNELGLIANCNLVGVKLNIFKIHAVILHC